MQGSPRVQSRRCLHATLPTQAHGPNSANPPSPLPIPSKRLTTSSIHSETVWYGPLLVRVMSLHPLAGLVGSGTLQRMVCARHACVSRGCVRCAARLERVLLAHAGQAATLPACIHCAPTQGPWATTHSNVVRPSLQRRPSEQTHGVALVATKKPITTMPSACAHRGRESDQRRLYWGTISRSGGTLLLPLHSHPGRPP